MTDLFLNRSSLKRGYKIDDMARRAKRLLVCIDNDGFTASLERRKIYASLPDASAERQGLVRVVDESGEDYLYPKQMFIAVDLPDTVRRAVLSDA